MILSSLPANSAGHYSEEPHDMVAQALRLPEQGKLDLGVAVASLTQGVCLANKWSLHPASIERDTCIGPDKPVVHSWRHCLFCTQVAPRVENTSSQMDSCPERLLFSQHSFSHSGLLGQHHFTKSTFRHL